MMAAENQAKGRAQAQREGRRWLFGWCEFVEISRQLFVHGKPVRIEAKPADVLALLLERPTEVLTKDELIGAAWSNTADGASDNSLTAAVRKLRSAFGGARDGLLLTVPNLGYRMAVPVTETLVSTPAPPSLHLKAGDPIPQRPNWRAQRALDAGSPETVWQAEHVKTHEVHVFKFAFNGVRLRALQREITLSRLLQRSLADISGFVRVLDWVVEEFPAFTESEYGGINLLAWSETEDFKLLSLEERIGLAASLAEIVASAHSVGILHNDLKPTNVLILKSEIATSQAAMGRSSLSGWQIKVADFGVASLTQPERLRQYEITQHGFQDGEPSGATPVGSGMYCAPEILAGAAPSTVADVYALGAMLYQIVCGDFLEPPSPGWESRVQDGLLLRDIADAAHIDPAARLATAAELAYRLRSMEARRVEQAARQAELARAERYRRELERARLRRPWIAVTMVVLVVGVATSLWFAQRAERAREEVERRNAALSAMNDFLSKDLLTQTNPLASQSRSASVEQETLLEAINRVQPQIDARFRSSPEIAGQLHMTIAAALDARTEYGGAASEFGVAAKRFRQAEGPLSQEGFVAELRQENSQMRTNMPSLVAEAKQSFRVQQQQISRLPRLSPDLQGWYAMALSAELLFGPHPEQAAPLLKTAIQEAEATLGFDSYLLSALQTRLGSSYLKANDPVDAEQASRRAILMITRSRGPESPALAQPRYFLQEALVMQGKYKDAIDVGNLNYKQAGPTLGAKNQLTLLILTVKAQSEAALQDYAHAIEDELAVYQVAKTLPSGSYLEEDTLSDVALNECRSGRISNGLAHARQVLRESAAGVNAQPVFVSTSNFAIAECLMAQEEGLGRPARRKMLDQAEAALRRVDVSLMLLTPGEGEIVGGLDVEEARLALLRAKPTVAKEYAHKAAPAMAKQQADAYEKTTLSRVVQSLGPT